MSQKPLAGRGHMQASGWGWETVTNQASPGGKRLGIRAIASSPTLVVPENPELRSNRPLSSTPPRRFAST